MHKVDTGFFGQLKVLIIHPKVQSALSAIETESAPLKFRYGSLH
jgi:hypothetical protein